MKRFWLSVVVLLAITTIALAAVNSVEAPEKCQNCGMDRTFFAQSRMVVTYSDDSSGTCSINCAVVDMQANRGKTVTSLQVGDYDTSKLIDAKTAVWVIGGKKRGVMTAVPKWAFADRKRAQKFIKMNGGNQATFDEVVKATEKELEELEKEKRQSLE
jgi:copper chaperone NosL